MKSVEEAKNTTPEELMISIKSATTPEWMDYNSTSKDNTLTQKQIEYRNSQNKKPEANYYELIHKLTFVHNGVETAIIKFWFVEDGMRMELTAQTFQKIDGRWHRTSIAGMSELESTIAMIKSEVFKQLVYGLPVEDEFINQLIKKTRTPSGLDFDMRSLWYELEKLSEDEELEQLNTILEE